MPGTNDVHVLSDHHYIQRGESHMIAKSFDQ